MLELHVIPGRPVTTVRLDGCCFWQPSRRPISTAVKNCSRRDGPSWWAVQVSHAVPAYLMHGLFRKYYAIDDNVLCDAASSAMR